MDDNKNQNQGSGVDISPDALKESNTQTVVRPKVNLAPNSQHEASHEATIENNNTVQPSSTNPENTPEDSQGQVKAPEKEKTDNTNEATEEPEDLPETPPVAPKQSSSTPPPPPPPKKTKQGMSDNRKYLLIGLLLVVLVAGGIVAWSLMNSDGDSAPAEDQVVEEPADTTEPAEEPVDTTSPEAVITSPGDSETVSETFTIEGTISDESAVESLVLYMNDSMAEEVDNPSESFSFEVDSMNFANGTYTMYVVATDSEGNVGESEEVTIEISNTPPEPAEDEESETTDESSTEEPETLPKTGAGWH